MLKKIRTFWVKLYSLYIEFYPDVKTGFIFGVRQKLRILEWNMWCIWVLFLFFQYIEQFSIFFQFFSGIFFVIKSSKNNIITCMSITFSPEKSKMWKKCSRIEKNPNLKSPPKLEFSFFSFAKSFYYAPLLI